MATNTIPVKSNEFGHWSNKLGLQRRSMPITSGIYLYETIKFIRTRGNILCYRLQHKHFSFVYRVGKEGQVNAFSTHLKLHCFNIWLTGPWEMQLQFWICHFQTCIKDRYPEHPVKLPQVNATPTTSQLRLGAVRQQAITWANIDPSLYRHMESLRHGELTLLTYLLKKIEKCSLVSILQCVFSLLARNSSLLCCPANVSKFTVPLTEQA